VGVVSGRGKVEGAGRVERVDDEVGETESARERRRVIDQIRRECLEHRNLDQLDDVVVASIIAWMELEL
jgi:hypothetical protein